MLCLSPLSAEPFLTQDQNPFSLIHGQPQPSTSKLPANDSLHWTLGMDITNTLNSVSSNSNQEVLFMDFESYHLRYSLHYGLGENWAVKIDIPIIHYGSGFLDNSVDSWHDAFGLPQGDRPGVANDQFRIFYNRDGAPVINLNTSSSGFGDIQLAVGRKIIHTSRTDLSLWTSIDLPTGDSKELTGNDASDVALLLAASYHFHSKWSTDANLGILRPGEDQLGTLSVEDNIIFGHAGLQWSPFTLVDFRIQFGGHTQYYENSQLLLLNKAYNIVIGGTVHVSTCSDFDIAFSEDIKVGATPDVSFLFTWKSKMGDCTSSTN